MKLYVDMDGVLCDFFSKAAKLSEAPLAQWRDMEVRDIERVLRRIRKHEKDFFANLKPFPQTNTLIQSIYNIAGGFSILSSPLAGDEENCERQKIEWIERYLHIDPDEIIITKDKTKYASENCTPNILIDDYGYNILKWEEAAGFGIKWQADEDKLVDVLVPLQILYKGQR